VADLVRVENNNVALVIAHLAEISRRKVDLERGYRGLFDYGVQRLGLSEGSVALRIQVANVARRFPQILAALAAGRISLTVAGRLARHLREDNVETLLADCAGMTKREVEAYLVRFDPQPIFGPSIRKRPDAREGTAPQSPPQSPLLEPLPLPPTPAGVLTPATPEMYNLRFGAGKEFKLQLERLAEVLGIENPAKNMAEVLKRALEIALEVKDPQRRLERRLERERQREKTAVESQSAAVESRPDEVVVSEPATSRHVPVAARDRVLERAGHQCQFTGPDGTRCTARTGLQIEHERPFAMYHSHDERFLSVLCRRHNQLRAEQVYGAEHIQARIEAGRLERTRTSRERCVEA